MALKGIKIFLDEDLTQLRLEKGRDRMVQVMAAWKLRRKNVHYGELSLETIELVMV